LSGRSGAVSPLDLPPTIALEGQQAAALIITQVGQDLPPVSGWPDTRCWPAMMWPSSIQSFPPLRPFRRVLQAEATLTEGGSLSHAESEPSSWSAPTSGNEEGLTAADHNALGTAPQCFVL